MKESSQLKVNKSRNSNEEDSVLVLCQTEYGKGTSCTVDGKEINSNISEAVEKGKKISEKRGVRAYFQNKSLGLFCTLEEFLNSCPKASQKIEIEEKIKRAKISIIIIIVISLLAYLWLTV